ncbi:hypothetical protein ACJJTC_009257 [Scirpophaga incertulas]
MNSKSCGGCLQVIKNRQFLCCCVCATYYDLLCANVSEHRFRNTLTGEHRMNWKCAACISREPKVDNSDTPVRGHDDKVMRRRGGAVPSPAECSSPEVVPSPVHCNIPDTVPKPSCVTLEALAGRLDMLVSEIRVFSLEMADTRRQVQAFDSKLSGLVTQVETCVSEVKELRARVEKLEKRAPSGTIEDTIESFKAELNARDQELLLNEVEFTCIPEHKGEDVVCAARVGRPPGSGASGSVAKPRPIVVRLVRRAVRDDLLRAVRVRRTVTTEGIDLPGQPGRFYVNERLTRANRALFWQAREVGRRLGWRFIWTRDGKIFARQHSEQDAPRHRLRTQADLVRVFGTDAIGACGNSPAYN